MSDYQCTKESFLKEVENHQMKIIKQDGLYRHISFGVPHSSTQQFDLITWKGHLCYCGDMGSYIFQRTDDMFSFFVKSTDYKSIDFGYWAEKVIAQDKEDGLRIYSPELFNKIIYSEVKYLIEEHSLNKDQIEELNEIIESEVIYANDNETYARTAVQDFIFYFINEAGEDTSIKFQDFDEYNLHEFTHRFKWCCHALIWGINKYEPYK